VVLVLVLVLVLVAGVLVQGLGPVVSLLTYYRPLLRPTMLD
jgi:hypothetical protein